MPSDQLLVFFDVFPTIDSAKLQADINALDPNEEDQCAVTEFTEAEEDQKGHVPILSSDHSLRISTGVVSLGEFQVGMLLHNVPAPNYCIEEAPMDEDDREHLKRHQAFALLNLMGGDEYHPIERVVMLYKVAIAMCEQGATGAGCEESLLAFPAEFLKALVKPEGMDVTVWQALREEWEPKNLFVRHLTTQINDENWALTLGHAMVSVPDLAYRFDKEEELEEVEEWFDAVYAYMMENGPVIEPGHTMGVDEKVAIRFVAPTEEQKDFERPNGMLILKKETA